MSKRTTADEEIQRLRRVIERLGSSEAMTMSRMLKPGQDDELIARIDYARSVSSEWTENPNTFNKTTSPEL